MKANLKIFFIEFYKRGQYTQTTLKLNDKSFFLKKLKQDGADERT